MNKLDLNYLFTLINIKQVVNSVVQLQKKSTNWWGLCPFHGDKTPSLCVSEQKGIFKCFSCGVSGNAVSFLQKLNNWPFLQALKHALELSNVDQSVLNTLNKNFQFSLKQKIIMLNKHAMQLMHDYLLMHLKDPLIQNFVQIRHLDLKTIENFNLGYMDFNLSANFFNQLTTFCQENFHDEVADDLITKSGLFIKSNADKTLHTFFHQRILFPIQDKDANVVGFSGRQLDGEKVKYLNTAENNLFHKGENLYNFFSLNTLSNVKEIILVEGYFDCITLVQNAFNNVCATMGTALTDKQQDLIFSLSKLQRVILSFDNDAAGQNAFMHNLQLILNYEIVHQLNIPVLISGLYRSTSKDPDELFKNQEQKVAHQIFSDYENGLFASCLFLIDSNNLEFTLNSALQLLVKYENNFILYTQEAKTLLQKYALEHFSISNEIFCKLYQIAQTNYQKQLEKKKKKIFIERKNDKTVSQQKNNELTIQKEQIFHVLLKFVYLLTTNYYAIIALFLSYPKEIKEIVLDYNENAYSKSVLNNDLKFKNLIRQIKQLQLKTILDSINQTAYFQFCIFGFLCVLYLDVCNLQDYEQHNWQKNQTLLLNNKILRHGLQEDAEWEQGKYFWNCVKTITQNWVDRYVENFQTPEELQNKFLKIVNNIWQTLVTIRDLLLRIHRFFLKN